MTIELRARFTRLAADPSAIAWPQARGSWLGGLALRQPGFPVPAWMLRQHDRRRQRVHRLVRQAGLFSAEWYRAQYGSLESLPADLLRHFIEYGAARGFLPSAAWAGLSTAQCIALAEQHGKPGRAMWRYMRAQRGPGSDVFVTRGLIPLGPFTPAAFAGTIERGEAGPGLPIDLVVVDHAMGGGANRYRDQRLAAEMARDRTVGLLTYHIAERRFAFEVRVADACVFAAASSLGEVETLLAPLQPRTLLVNNLASYPDVPRVLALLRRFADERASRIEFPLHDYLSVCPSFNLLDDRLDYCGVPALARCRNCLEHVELPIPTAAAPRDIVAWRSAWAGLLERAAPILAFSTASLDLLRRAHPSLDPDRSELRPHLVDYLPQVQLPLDLRAPLHIGVVGEISFAKGAAIVAALAAALRRRPSEVRLTVIGTVDKRYADGIVQTGRYDAADLPGLLASSGVNVCLVPSIWPETFCYVAEELMRLGLPVAAFDLGAPAERLRGYALGHVLRSREPERVLDELSTFWQALRSRGTTAPPAAAMNATGRT